MLAQGCNSPGIDAAYNGSHYIVLGNIGCPLFPDNICTDWFLPSLRELRLMKTNLSEAGVAIGFPDVFYWSFSEYDSVNAWNMNMVDASVVSTLKA